MSRKNKYSESFKLKAVQKVLKNNLSITLVCDNLEISKTELLKWIKYYSRYGISGLKPRVNNTSYSGDFKLSIILSIEDKGYSFREAALRNNIPDSSTLRNWYHIYQDKGGIGLYVESRGRPKTMTKKIQRKSSKKPLTREEELLLENKSLRAELALLKKLDALGSSQKEKSIAIEGLRQDHELPLLLQHTSMARSSFYYHIKTLKGLDKYKQIKLEIQEIYHKHYGRYGYRRITIELRKIGHLINHKTVRKLMIELGLKSLIRVKKYKSYKGEQGKIAPNILSRDFEASSMYEKWVTDITEFKVSGEKLYLSPIMDLYNREIISYELSESPNFKQVVNMLNKAFRTLPKQKDLL